MVTGTCEHVPQVSMQPGSQHHCMGTWLLLLNLAIEQAMARLQDVLAQYALSRHPCVALA